MYPTYKNLNLPEIDKDILRFWEEHDVFKQSISQRDGAENFVFYEGPPSANGKPGIHHVIARTIKDLFCRYQTLNGKRVERKGGWDTHGLPIELNVEKELGITKEDIGKTITVDEYNQKCRETVMRFKNEWDDITRKMGYWVDLEHPYITFENSYIESVWWLLQRLYDKGLLYKGYTIQPYSPAAGTGLSSHELNQPGCYREVTDTTVVGMFKVLKDEKSAFLYDSEDEDVRILAWTTTPWTLPSNTALTIGKNIEYVKIKTANPYTQQPVSVVLAQDLIGKWFGGKNQPEVQEQSAPIFSDQLDGIRYEPLLDFGNPIEPLLGSNGYGTDAYRVLVGDFVTTEDGTGVVHTAPSFGADDMRVAKTNGIGALTLVDKQGKFKDTVGEFSGRYVKNYTDDPAWESVDIDIAVHLKQTGKAFNVQKYAHNYPHCWRTDKPVLYYPLDSWFVRASAAKERMYELNQTINWKPASTGEGRFGKWLENLQDWNLSRSRYWGIPLPIWRNADATLEKCIGSVEELAQEIEKANAALGLQQNVPADLHRPYIDDVVLVTDDGQPMRRELDLIDVWFDSGAMPYAQFHFGPTPALPRGKGAVEGNGEETPFFQTADPTKYGKLKDFARQNRKNQTLGEEAMWQLVKGKNVGGFKFRRQHIIGDVIVDFVCLSRLLVVEVDGGYHGTPEAQEYDRLRTEYLGEQGYIVVRFSNEHIINAPDEIEKILLKELNHRPLFTKEQIREGKHLTPPFGGAGGRGAFPADFISEGVDQTRGWFYTLHAIATMVFDSVAFKNVLSTGLVLDAKGEKMSKTKGNVANPFEVIAQHGADATRWYMMSNTDPWENLKFSTDGIVESRNKFFGTLFNTYNFFAMYAGIDKFVMDEDNVLPYEERPELDRWIISKLYHLVADFREAMDDYEPTKACRAIEGFVDEHLSNWYVRLSRRRFWKASTDDDGKDKMAAYQTLFECLMVVTQLASPVAPFFSDWMYRNLTAPLRDKAKAGASPLRHESVHLSDLTQPDPTKVDAALEQRMDYAQRICSLALSLRKREKLRVRQPLQKILLPILDPSFQAQVDAVADLIKAEINVKEIEYVTDTSGIITKKAKPNFKTLGKRLGKAMKAAADVIAALSQEQINDFERSKTLSISIEGQAFELEPEDLDIVTEDIPGWMVATDGEITVALDVTLNESLRVEGIARDLVNRIQSLRKEKDFNVTDKIVVTLEKNPDVLKVFEQFYEFGEYVKGETLIQSVRLVDSLNVSGVELNDETMLKMEIHKINRIWKPIAFDKTWENCDTSTLDDISPSWFTRREKLTDNALEYKEFIERLKRQHAIETGIVERMYDLSAGVTETFIKEGFISSLLSHGDTNIPQQTLMRYLNDHLDAVNWVFDLVKEDRPFSVSMIKQLHQLVTRHQEYTEGIDSLGRRVNIPLLKGAFKQNENNPIRPDGTLVFYCPPEHVDSEMDNLVRIYADMETKCHPLTLASWLHHAFTTIHPFQDGNGRVARLLASLILIKSKLFPFTVLREEAKAKYIEALEKADRGEPQDLVSYLGGVQKRNIQKALNVKEISSSSFEDVQSALIDKIRKQKEIVLQEHLEMVERGRRKVFDICNDYLTGVEQNLKSKLGADTNVYLKKCSFDDRRIRETEKGKIPYQDFYFNQIVKYAKEHDYYFNWSLPKAWILLGFDLLAEKQYRIGITIHHFGYEDSVLAIGAFLDYKGYDTEEKMKTYFPLVIPPHVVSLLENGDSKEKNIRQHLEDTLTAAMAQIASEL